MEEKKQSVILVMTSYAEGGCATEATASRKEMEMRARSHAHLWDAPTAKVWMHGDRNVEDAFPDYLGMLPIPHIQSFRTH